MFRQQNTGQFGYDIQFYLKLQANDAQNVQLVLEANMFPIKNIMKIERVESNQTYWSVQVKAREGVEYKYKYEITKNNQIFQEQDYRYFNLVRGLTNQVDEWNKIWSVYELSWDKQEFFQGLNQLRNQNEPKFQLTESQNNIVFNSQRHQNMGTKIDREPIKFNNKGNFNQMKGFMEIKQDIVVQMNQLIIKLKIEQLGQLLVQAIGQTIIKNENLLKEQHQELIRKMEIQQNEQLLQLTQLKQNFEREKNQILSQNNSAITKLQEELNKSKQEIESLNNKIKQNNEEYDKLHHNYSDVISKYDQLNSDYKDFQKYAADDIAKFKNQLLDSQIKYDYEKGQMQTKLNIQIENDKIQSQIFSGLNEAILNYSNSQEEFEKLKNSSDDDDDDDDQLEQIDKLESLEQKNASKKKKNLKLKQQLEDCEQKLSETEKKLEETENRIEQLKSEQQQQYSNQIEKYKETIVKLKEQIKESRKELDNYKQILKKVQIKLEVAEGQNKELEIKYTEYQQKCENLQQNIHHQQQQFAVQNQKQMENYEAKLEDLKDQINTLTNEKNKVQQQFQDLIKEKNQLEEENTIEINQYKEELKLLKKHEPYQIQVIKIQAIKNLCEDLKKRGIQEI